MVIPLIIQDQMLAIKHYLYKVEKKYPFSILRFGVTFYRMNAKIEDYLALLSYLKIFLFSAI
jgi:hypothetical protein